ADMLGERVGETVGYRVRMDSRVGARTRIEVVTEGVLTRFLQDDPALEGVGLVIFDEFHERSLHADLGLALTLQTRELLRDDLRVLVMSATLDVVGVARLLGDAPVVSSEGRSFPVETRYLGRRRDARLEPQVAAAVVSALADDDGDVLVFLPGAGEIRRVEALLAERELPPGVAVVPLFGDLPQHLQDLAIRPSEPGRRKVVLATAIAETSLTIEGVRVVVDAGLMRVPRFSARTGMTRLETVRVTRASAAQRCGRAGRLAPGVCYRLWEEQEQLGLVPHGTPEILEADLAPLVLELAAAGIIDPAELRWLDPPPASAVSQARELLAQLGAVEASGRITPHGRRMAALALHPRLAHMLLRAKEHGAGATAALLAALLAERDIVRGAGTAPDADVRLRLDLLRGGREDAPDDGRAPAVFHGLHVDREAVRRARLEARHWRERMGIPPGNVDESDAGLLLAWAYPERIAQRRPGAGGRFLLRNGTGAAFAPPEHPAAGAPQPLAESPYIVAAETDGRRPESRIFLAAPITLEELRAHFGDQTERDEVIAWDDETRQVLARRRERLGAIILSDAPLRDPDPEGVARALLQGLARMGMGALPWGREGELLRRRLAFLHRIDPSWPDASDEALLASLPEWLAPHLYGMRRLEDVRRLDLGALLLGALPWERRAALDELAPTHITVPSGSRIPIDYTDPAAPVLAVRLQEMFGLAETPRIARGAVPLTLHLLSPAYRPVQVTRDLAGFWRSTYFEVRKELKGRYPKHYWPDDPMQA
ncbi:MAG TPA: ATP-dependent helicase HrpB, partial [Gemmatimonadaceae bacterium]|nr:ATP-dependent helicase HrpB [Gemmatimonadaceae bacterium]